MTGEDRGVASSYHVGDSVRYLRGSEALGIEAKTYSTVIQTDTEQNLITVKKPNGEFATYDPERLKGVTIYEPELRSLPKAIAFSSLRRGETKASATAISAPSLTWTNTATSAFSWMTQVARSAGIYARTSTSITPMP